MQNRGQLAAGMTSYQPGPRRALLKTHKELGHRRRGVPPQPPGQVRGDHARAATARRRSATSATPPAAATDRSYAQPFEREHGRKTKWFAFAFNGQLANYQELKRELLEQGDYHLKRDTDTEIIMHSLSYELQGEGPDDRLAGRLQPARRAVRRGVQHRRC